MLRIVILCVTVFTLLWAATGQTADTHEGKVVTASSGKLTMTDAEGKNQHTMDVPATAIIMREGKTATLTDLKPGDTIAVTMKKTGEAAAITKVEATPASH